MAQQQKILVTGVAGALGRDLFSRLELFDSEWDVIGTTHEDLDFLLPEPEFHAVLDSLSPDIIINTAAFTQVDLAETNSEIAKQINGIAVANLSRWAKQKAAYLVHISTDYVFDGHSNSPYTTEDATHPINVYGQTKLEGELAVQEILPAQGAVVRTSWLFGPGSKNFVPFILNAAETQTPVRVADDQHGTPTWTGNLSKMLIDVLRERPAGILHGCSATGTTRYEQALFICKTMGLSTDFMTPVPTESFNFKAERPLYCRMESSFETALSWETAIEKYLQTQGLVRSHV